MHTDNVGFLMCTSCGIQIEERYKLDMHTRADIILVLIGALELVSVLQSIALNYAS